MALLRRFDGIVSANEFRTDSTWYRIGYDHGLSGRDWACRAASENPCALIDYSAGYEAGVAAKAAQ